MFWRKKRKKTPSSSTKIVPGRHLSENPGRGFDTALPASDPAHAQGIAREAICSECGCSGGHEVIGGSTWVRTLLDHTREGFRIQLMECRQCKALNPIVFKAYEDGSIDKQIKSVEDGMKNQDEKTRAGLLGSPGGFPVMHVARGGEPGEYMHKVINPENYTTRSKKFHMSYKICTCPECDAIGTVGLFQMKKFGGIGTMVCGNCGNVVRSVEHGSLVENLKPENTDHFMTLAEKETDWIKESPLFESSNLVCRYCDKEKFIVKYLRSGKGSIVCAGCGNVAFLLHEGEELQVYNLPEDILDPWFESAGG